VIGGALRSAAVATAVCLLAFCVSACGGGDDSGTTGAAAPSGTTSESGGGSTAKAKGDDSGTKGRSGEESAKPQHSDGSGSSANAAPVRVSGGGSGQFRTPGGDNSIQSFGEESDESELERAALALHGFLVARAEEDWPGACSHLAGSTVGQLEQFVAKSQQLKGKGCAGILAALTSPLLRAERRESTVVDAGSLRIEGERAFLIYYGAGKAVYTIAMIEEGADWKVAALAPVPLS
jgi:hypothetical protein